MVSPRHFIAGAVACAALLTGAAPATAGTVTSDGTNVRFDGGAEVNDLILSTDDAGALELSGTGVDAGAGCTLDEGFGTIDCPLGAAGTVTVVTGPGNDEVTLLELGGSAGQLGGRLAVDLGDGNDAFKGGEGADSVAGGAGVDTLEGLGGADRLDGGADDDTLKGDLGGDTLLGGDGNDALDPDGYASAGEWAGDTVDGGAGVDTVAIYNADGQEASRPPFDLTLDGVANDGRQGEGDNVAGVEKFNLGAAGTFVGDDAANEVTAPETGAAGSYDGRGGDDVITAGDAHGDVVTGGAGNDTLTGGFGNDTITGGPGKDIVNGDRAGRCNELHCDLPGGQGDDTIDVRDGEADSVTCGIGTDKVTADAADAIAADCEQVDKGGGPGPAAGTVKVRATKTSLKRLAKRGLAISVTCPAACALTAKLTVSKAAARKLKLRGRTLATAKRSLKAAGTAKLRAKPSRKLAKRIRRQRKLAITVTVRAGGKQAGTTRLTLKR